ncbi:MAG TPA: bifunctional DNA-binding transcriptional regulator/O6-methylguanine-DNA methyltransferase Ada [Gemmatimonadales bacterium]
MTVVAPDVTSERWDAVLARDAAADGRFVYAVRSTRIFCRPTCPSKRPARRQVDFFDTPAEATQAGYRPCLRCRPTEATPSTAARKVVELVTRAITAHAGRVTLAQLAITAGTTRDKLQRTFTETVGVSPQRYAEAVRLGRLRQLLRGGKSITHAQNDAGFTSSSRLYDRVQQRLGMTPATYKKGGPGLAVRYTVAACPAPLGRVLVAATDRGICAVRLGGTEAALLSDLKAEFHAATITRDHEALAPWVDAVVTGLTHPERLAALQALPLDIRATAFQARVWAALRALPVGATTSYHDLARSIGQPSATRAVARACATNPVAVVIPCHRVVRDDGDLAGYRWGLERKAALLQLESAAIGQ